MTLNNTLFYNWKKHDGSCGSAPTTGSITSADAIDSINTQRLGSWHFYQGMGQPAIGIFVCYNGICYEYMGTTQDPGGGGTEYGAIIPSPALTS